MIRLANENDVEIILKIYQKAKQFLRENKNYRDAVYVEHFYSKDYLNKLLQQGMILMRKGQYRF